MGYPAAARKQQLEMSPCRITWQFAEFWCFTRVADPAIVCFFRPWCDELENRIQSQLCREKFSGITSSGQEIFSDDPINTDFRLDFAHK